MGGLGGRHADGVGRRWLRVGSTSGRRRVEGAGRKGHTPPGVEGVGRGWAAREWEERPVGAACVVAVDYCNGGSNPVCTHTTLGELARVSETSVQMIE